jgi:hypothetical protein
VSTVARTRIRGIDADDSFLGRQPISPAHPASAPPPAPTTTPSIRGGPSPSSACTCGTCLINPAAARVRCRCPCPPRPGPWPECRVPPRLHPACVPTATEGQARGRLACPAALQRGGSSAEAGNRSKQALRLVAPPVPPMAFCHTREPRDCPSSFTGRAAARSRWPRPTLAVEGRHAACVCVGLPSLHNVTCSGSAIPSPPGAWRRVAGWLHRTAGTNRHFSACGARSAAVRTNAFSSRKACLSHHTKTPWIDNSKLHAKQPPPHATPQTHFRLSETFFSLAICAITRLPEGERARVSVSTMRCDITHAHTASRAWTSRQNPLPSKVRRPGSNTIDIGRADQCLPRPPPPDPALFHTLLCMLKNAWLI